jgi:ABC-type polysaccharide/polyol phosphate export permease
MVVYTIVFSTIMRFPVTGAPYPVFLLAGLLGWNFFSQAVSGSVNSVVGNAVLIKKLAFRRSLLTVSSVTAAFVNYLISLVLLVPLVLLFHVPIGIPLLMLPVLVMLIYAVALGLSLMVAAANVYFRDIEYLMTISLQVWFFLTPIIYQIDLIADRAAKSHNLLAPAFQWLLYANPLTWLATSAQDVIAFNRWPQHWVGLGYSAAFAVVSLALGYALFQRMQVRFAEEL